MRIQRRFTEPGQSPYDSISFRESSSEIRNPDGSTVFALERFLVPSNWSQVAADILAQKYFRKAGIPAKAKRVEENAVPSWLWRSVPDEAALAELPEDERRELEAQGIANIAQELTGGFYSAEYVARQSAVLLDNFRRAGFKLD